MKMLGKNWFLSLVKIYLKWKKSALLSSAWFWLALSTKFSIYGGKDATFKWGKCKLLNKDCKPNSNSLRDTLCTTLLLRVVLMNKFPGSKKSASSRVKIFPQLSLKLLTNALQSKTLQCSALNILISRNKATILNFCSSKTESTIVKAKFSKLKSNFPLALSKLKILLLCPECNNSNNSNNSIKTRITRGLINNKINSKTTI